MNDQDVTEASLSDGPSFRRETEQVVNEIAQELRTLDDGAAWFSGLSQARRQNVLNEVAKYAMQAHITAADGRAGVAQSGVKPTANPSVTTCARQPRSRNSGYSQHRHRLPPHRSNRRSPTEYRSSVAARLACMGWCGPCPGLLAAADGEPWPRLFLETPSDHA
ncbi:DUF5958 family protein [Streptomyces sp. NPDC056224]|uniref:DUF5958 family protein n=1 Tax=Streptomyces sp. NPDC056224 TaxID=3345750 RepID=UPI0035E0D2B6